jgi:penicillin-binding protein 1C
MRTGLKLLASAGLCGLLLVASFYLVPLPARLEPELSTAVYSTEGVLLRAYLSREDTWRLPVTLAELPRFVVDGLQCIEDQRFWLHPGVDPLAIGRALLQNLAAGTTVSGGSTITMQIVRLLEPRPRTLGSKLLEAWRAFQLEWYLEKTDLLRLYLTYAPYGGNVEGIAAASQVYFGHTPSRLTPAEAAFLYLLPQAPGRWQRFTPDMWRRARQRILKRLAACGVLSPEEVRQAHRAPLPSRRLGFPLHAGHAADYVRAQAPEQTAFRTTIAADVQRFLEDLVRRKRRAFATNGIHNIAVIVVENATRAIRGLVGNFDYTDDEHGQNIAAFTVPRSPGSTLKPLLYALALDRAVLLPETLLLDVPSRFGQYTPGNFTGTYSGLVAAEQALSQSLNVPFVRLLQRLGVDHFLSFLELGGVRIATPRIDLGLSLIVGGIEIAPLELVELYVHLANGGRRGKLRLLETGRRQPAEAPWLSPGAVYLTGLALAKRDRPDFPQRKRLASTPPDVRWKTGTSQGRRDAWSIGYTEQYTVLVWLGNLDYQPSPQLIGARSAAPLMFEILEALQTQTPSGMPLVTSPFADLQEVEVCAFSGDRASPFCPLTRHTWGVRGHIPAYTCRFHKRILRDMASGLRVVRRCDQGLRTELANVLDLPASVLHWMRTTLHDQTLLPPFHPQCKQLPVTGGTLRIRSPVDGSRYVLLPSFGQRRLHLRLDLQHSGSAEQVRCILNGAQLRSGRQDFGPVLSLGRGTYHLFCSNLDGASDESHFEVAGPATLPRLSRP